MTDNNEQQAEENLISLSQQALASIGFNESQVDAIMSKCGVVAGLLVLGSREADSNGDITVISAENKAKLLELLNPETLDVAKVVEAYNNNENINRLEGFVKITEADLAADAQKYVASKESKPRANENTEDLNTSSEGKSTDELKSMLEQSKKQEEACAQQLESYKNSVKSLTDRGIEEKRAKALIDKYGAFAVAYVDAYVEKKNPEKKKDKNPEKYDKKTKKYTEKAVKYLEGKDPSKEKDIEKLVKKYNKCAKKTGRTEIIAETLKNSVEHSPDEATLAENLAKATAYRESVENAYNAKVEEERKREEEQVRQQQNSQSVSTEKETILQGVKNTSSKLNEEQKKSKISSWLQDVNSDVNADALVEKYGVEAAYKIVQDCMLEPKNVMDKIGEGYKNSREAIKHFADLELNDAGLNTLAKYAGVERQSSSSQGVTNEGEQQQEVVEKPTINREELRNDLHQDREVHNQELQAVTGEQELRVTQDGVSLVSPETETVKNNEEKVVKPQNNVNLMAYNQNRGR